VTVGSYRRLLALPAALARHTVTGARVGSGSLQVKFRIDHDGAPVDPAGADREEQP
jgi:arsenite-transporting ATPase